MPLSQQEIESLYQSRYNQLLECTATIGQLEYIPTKACFMATCKYDSLKKTLFDKYKKSSEDLRFINDMDQESKKYLPRNTYFI